VECTSSNLVAYKLMRRSFILVMAVILGGLGQIPLSASVLSSSNWIGCASPKIQVNCDDMNMDAGSSHMAAAENASCCFVSGMPANESQFIVSAPTVAPAPTAIPLSPGDAPRVRTVPSDVLRLNFSPPASQSRLCIFVI
jgi:hypothetical protein